MTESPAYLDYQSTTPLDPQVEAAMMPFLNKHFGNPHSINHQYGWDASDAVDRARAQVAALISCGDHEVIFTSGATESCNLAIRGVLRACRSSRKKVITVQTEHPAVYNTVLDAKTSGFESVVLPVASDGLLDVEALERVLDEQTLLVSIMAVNNEIGVIQPIADIASRCRAVGAYFHTDATQAAGRIPIDVQRWGVDLLSISSHKVYGPKGVGALFVRDGVEIEPIMTGGSQERGLRPGTVPTPLAVGFGKACEVAVHQLGDDTRHLTRLSELLRSGIDRCCPSARFFGHLEQRISGSFSIGFPAIPANQVIDAVSDDIAISTGSACASASVEPSRVLLSLGLTPRDASTAVRISFGRYTSENDIDTALNAFSRIRPNATWEQYDD